MEESNKSGCIPMAERSDHNRRNDITSDEAVEFLIKAHCFNDRLENLAIKIALLVPDKGGDSCFDISFTLSRFRKYCRTLEKKEWKNGSEWNSTGAQLYEDYLNCVRARNIFFHFNVCYENAIPANFEESLERFEKLMATWQRVLSETVHLDKSEKDKLVQHVNKSRKWKIKKGRYSL